MEPSIALACLGVAGMIGCLLAVVQPLWASGNQLVRGWRASTVWADWLDRKATLLFNLEDLAHEQRLGKISGGDYGRLQASYKKELAALLDQMQGSRPPADFEAFMLAQDQVASPSARKDRACFPCKTFYEEDFAFCPKCGTPLTARP